MFGKLFTITPFSKSQKKTGLSLFSFAFQKKQKRQYVLFDPDSVELFKPRIAVCGVGGAGGNAVDTMLQNKLTGVEFVVCNTDQQILSQSLSPNTVLMGRKLTKGLGAGSDSAIGAKAAEESIGAIMKFLEGCSLVFLAAGLGGGTGTGAAPVIARHLKSKGILTVAVTSTPFQFEGGTRREIARDGLKELKASVDSVIIVPNKNLEEVADEDITLIDSFALADTVLYKAVRTVSDLVLNTGLINLDFGDICTVMKERGSAMIGFGEGHGDGKALEAAKKAVNNKLLGSTSMAQAKGIIVNITGGNDLTLPEAQNALMFIQEEASEDTQVVFGVQIDPEMKDKVRISIIATGLDCDEEQI